MISSLELQSLVTQGLLSEKQAAAILAYQWAQKTSWWWFSHSIMTIGALLVGLGILSLVALNRDGMQDILKISILLITMTVSYLLWWYFKIQQKSFLWGALLFLSGLICGTSIFLIAQIYHLTWTNDILLGIWIVMILPLVYVLRQKEFYWLYMILLSCVLGQFLMSHVFDSVDTRNVAVAYILFWYVILFLWYIHEQYYDDMTLTWLYKSFWWIIITISTFFFFGMSGFFLKEYILSSTLIVISCVLLFLFLFRWFYYKQQKFYFLITGLFCHLLWILFHYFNLENFEWNIPVIYTWLSILLIEFWIIHQYLKHDEGMSNLYKFLWLNIWLISYFIFIATIEFNEVKFIFASSVLWFLCSILIITLLFWIFRNNKYSQFLSFFLCCVIFWIQFAHLPVINYIIFIIICLSVLYLSHTTNNKWLKSLMNIYLYLFLLYLYGKYGREYENKALFFIIGGVLMIGLGLWFQRLNKVIEKVLSPNTLSHDK